MRNWVGTLSAHAVAGRPAVLVSVASARGSVPRRPGTRMIVTSEGIDGTIGGGHLEHKAIGIARELLAAHGPLALHRIPLAASLGQCCGGVAQLLFEPERGLLVRFEHEHPQRSFHGATIPASRRATPSLLGQGAPR